jgi:hypothetical protein
MYFNAWVETMKFHGMNIAGDPRAGEMQSANGQTNYTGQLAKAHFFIDQMAKAEGLELGDPVIAPNEPLVSGGPYRPNMFGIGFGFVIYLTLFIPLLWKILSLFEVFRGNITT